MRFKSSSDNKKPWEKIPLDEIQPYPSPYNKVILITYLYAFSVFVIKFMSVNSIFDPFIPFIKMMVYGVFAFVVLKIILKKKVKDSIKGIFMFIVPPYTLVLVIINLIVLSVMKISLSDVFGVLFNLIGLLYLITWYFYTLFGLIAIGSVIYLFMSEYPKIKIQAYILTLMFFFIYFVSGNFIKI
ncbi:hypothetical protein [Methanobacterium petrolearium]|uniref:hypothetical protein n=1 Tax=Methanobacterium petrolearium TaxID=710190 RepID=UPI001AE52B58|nr:hypothetical protein [Methanobacterium petrolearium]MBP1946056.1 hypothetical protein [Methanobacterium petrolearium]